MRISRMTMAVLTGALVVVTWLLLQFLPAAILPGFVGARAPMWIAVAVGVGALWLADRYELMAPSQTPPVVDLYEKDEPEVKRGRDAGSASSDGAGRSE